jgi:endonuclease/exonuclease/phosphatase family protein
LTRRSIRYFPGAVLFALSLALLTGCSGGSSSGGGSASTSAATTSLSGPSLVTSSATTSPATSQQAAAPQPAPSPAGLANGTLEFLTYNVAGLPPFIARTQPATSIPQISPKLNSYDLAVIQEDFWYHASLIQSAQHPFQSTPLQGHATLLNDGLTRFSQTPFGTLQRIRWGTFHGPDGLSAKGFSAAQHELSPGVIVWVINHHADSAKGLDDQRARAQQFAQLARYLNTTLANQPLIVAGDTNLHTHEVMDQSTLADFMGTANLTQASRALGQNRNKLDKVFFRSGPRLELKPSAWRVANEFRDAAGNRLSDHDPIHVTFDWQER